MSTRALLLLACGGLGFGCSESYVIARTLEQPGPACLPSTNASPSCEPLPQLDDIRIETRGDTAIVQFAPVLAARDYRIYPMPDPSAVQTDDNGRQVVRNAIYRCAGKRTVADREDEYGAVYEESLVADVHGYARSESEAKLGYVFRKPGVDRLPVYRMADPSGPGGYHNASWIPPLYSEANSAEYVASPATRSELLKRGFRDDGIAFYIPKNGDLTIYRAAYQPDAHQGNRVSLFFSDGPEHTSRSAANQSQLLDLGERFRVLSKPQPDSVPLYRVTYFTGSTFDVLAAGEAAYQHVLHQGGPVRSLTWSGLTRKTTLVIEALDAGCPFPNAYVAAFPARASDTDTGAEAQYPSNTLDALRSADTGEVFINGQHNPQNRPQPIARTFVEVSPRPAETMSFSTSFSDTTELANMTVHQDLTATVYRNERWSIETGHCGSNFTYGSVLGQLFLGAPECQVSLVPRNFQPRIEANRFLHVRMATDLASTARRYPQLLITTARSVEAKDVSTASDLPIHNRLGPLYPSELPGADSSLIVQTHYTYHEAQIQFCGHRGWGVSAFCPRANIYGYDAGDPDAQPDQRWLPVPVIGDLVGFDRPVQLDVYASTERVYLFMDGRPVGCALLPAGEMAAGDVTVAFRNIISEPTKDELILSEPGRSFEREFSQAHSDRHMDDLGIDVGVKAPAWDESLLPCAQRWYGGRLLDE